VPVYIYFMSFRQVASYDFVMPVKINDTGAPSPTPTPLPWSSNSDSSTRGGTQHIIHPRPVHTEIITPRRRVVATALRQPLCITPSQQFFTVPLAFKDEEDQRQVTDIHT